MSIFQFFQFSPKLSAFTEILKSSKSDVGYFLFILVMIYIGYGIMGTFYFGANLHYYSDIIFTIMSLFKYTNTYYDFTIYGYNSLAPLWFITFEIIFVIMLLNMLIGILMAHYDEYEVQQALMKITQKESQNNSSMLKLLFLVFRKNITRKSFKQSKYKVLRNWYSFWKDIEAKIVFFTDNSDHLKQREQRIKQKQRQLLQQIFSLYKTPDYKSNNKFMTPYLTQEMQDDQSERQLTQQFLNYKETNNDDNENTINFTTQNRLLETDIPLITGQTENLKTKDIQLTISSENQQQSKQLKIKEKANEKKSKQEQQKKISNNQFLEIQRKEKKVIEDLNLGIINQILQNVSIQDKTFTPLWSACLENELFQGSNNTILFSDLNEFKDDIHSEEYLQVYDPENFTDFQVTFIAIESKKEQIKKWCEANLEDKVQLWEILDFKKRFDDENKINEEENLQDYLEFINSVTKQDANSSFNKPILTFKRIQQCPELESDEFSRASQLQFNLWLYYTCQKQKIKLWLKFNSYLRIKLWNKLTFSEDYALNIINSKNLTRQDLAMHFLKKFIQIRGEVLGVYELKNQQLMVQLVIFPDGQALTKEHKELLEEKQKVDKNIKEIKERTKKLQDILRDAPTKLREKYLDPEFFLQTWDILKQHQFHQKKSAKEMEKEKQNKKEEPGAEVDGVRDSFKLKKQKVITPTIVDDMQEQKYVQKIFKKMRKSLKVIDKFDFEEQKVVKPIYPQIDGSVNQQTYLINQQKLKRGTVSLLGQEMNTQLQDDPISNEGLNAFRSKELWSRLQQIQELNQLNKQRQKEQFKEIVKNLKEHKEVLINSQDLVHTQKKYFELMVIGSDGLLQQRMHLKLKEQAKKLKEEYQENEKYRDLTQLEKNQKMNNKIKGKKYQFLIQNYSKHEHRLPLWFALDKRDRLKMLLCQKIEGEAEMMSMLLMEEQNFQKKGQNSMDEIDEIMERGLDTLTYQKYMKFAEIQALTFTSLEIDELQQRLLDEDQDLIEYIIFLQSKVMSMSRNKDQIKTQLKKMTAFNQLKAEKLGSLLNPQKEAKKRRNFRPEASPDINMLKRGATMRYLNKARSQKKEKLE